MITNSMAPGGAQGADPHGRRGSGIGKKRLATLGLALGLALVSMGTAVSNVAGAQGGGGNQGAVWTSDSGCDQTNGNVTYATRQDVYMNGGGQSSDLPDGTYWVKIIAPGKGGAETILGKSTTAVWVVTNHVGTCSQLWSMVKSASSGFTAQGYDWTTNSGGEYQVIISLDSAFSGGTLKSDNYKVAESATPSPSLPTEEPSLPTEEPSLPTEEPSLPTEEPSLSTEEPTATPVESVEGASFEASPSPSESVEAATQGTKVTPPPTSSGRDGRHNDGAPVAIAILLLAFAMFGAVVTVPARRTRR